MLPKSVAEVIARLSAAATVAVAAAPVEFVGVDDHDDDDCTEGYYKMGLWKVVDCYSPLAHCCARQESDHSTDREKMQRSLSSRLLVDVDGEVVVVVARAAPIERDDWIADVGGQSTLPSWAELSSGGSEGDCARLRFPRRSREHAPMQWPRSRRRAAPVARRRDP